MTLWNIIRDWFVQYIWGGIDSTGEFYYENACGYLSFYDTNGDFVDSAPYFTSSMVFSTSFVGDDYTGYTSYLSIGDWLSTTSTIICLTLLVVACIYFLIWLFRFVSGLYLLRS